MGGARHHDLTRPAWTCQPGVPPPATPTLTLPSRREGADRSRPQQPVRNPAMPNPSPPIATALLLTSALTAARAADPPKPLKVLLVCGGCCHDYTDAEGPHRQGPRRAGPHRGHRRPAGRHGHEFEDPALRDDDWSKGYDLVIHDECFSDVKEPPYTARILAPHKAGLPAVVLHCAMHSYRDGTDEWFKFLGVTSRRHGAGYAHEVLNVDPQHPVMAKFGPAWINPAGELYWIEKVWPTAHPLATSKNKEKGNDEVCVWTNQYEKARVFGTTLGHHNETVGAPQYLDLLTRGVLWAAGKLDAGLPQGRRGRPEGRPRQPRPGPAGIVVEHAGRPPRQGRLRRQARAPAGAPRRPDRRVAPGRPGRAHLRRLRPARLGVERRLSLHGRRLEGRQGVDAPLRRVEEHDAEPEQRRLAPGPLPIRPRDLPRPRGRRLGEPQRVRGLRRQDRHPRPQGRRGREGRGLSERREDPRRLRGDRLRRARPRSTTRSSSPPRPNGDLYVSSDRNGSLDRQPHRGSVYRLRDLDGDGRADEVKRFIPDVDSPRGLVWDHDRLYLMHPPHLSAFIDKDGDGVADEQKILVKDIAFTFKDRPADHTSNGVTLGIDGWLYLAIGDFGFLKAEGTDGKTLQLRGGGVVRVRPDGTGLELYSQGTRNILEVAMDPLLNGFARDNTNDGGGWDIRLHHFTGMDDHGYPSLFKNFPGEIVQPLADYGGGSGCGALYLSEPGFPDGYGDALYTADWGRDRVFRHKLTPKGATFTADQTEFLTVPRVTDLDVDANGSHLRVELEGRHVHLQRARTSASSSASPPRATSPSRCPTSPGSTSRGSSRSSNRRAIVVASRPSAS